MPARIPRDGVGERPVCANERGARRESEIESRSDGDVDPRWLIRSRIEINVIGKRSDGLFAIVGFVTALGP